MVPIIKIKLWFIVAMIFTGNLYAQVTGNAYLTGPDDNSGIKIKFFKQSKPYMTDSTVTKSNGHYSISLPEGPYRILFKSEGFDSVYYNGGNNVYLNSTASLQRIELAESYLASNEQMAAESLISLSGLVHQGSGYLNNGIVQIVNRNTQVTTIGKINSDGSFRVDSTESGRFYIYAVPDPRLADGYLPTYYVNSLIMSQSASISSAGNVTGLDIYLVQQPVSEKGISLLEGRFSYGDNNSDNNTMFNRPWFSNSYTPLVPIEISSEPCKNMPVLLYNSANQIVGQSVTDLEGYYSFKNLVEGNYRIQGQRFGYITEQGGFISVPGSGTTQTNLRMIRERVVTNLTDKYIFNLPPELHPNPFTDKLIISNDKDNFTITDVSGKIYYNTASPAYTDINTEKWPSGLYLVKSGKRVNKLFKK